MTSEAYNSPKDWMDYRTSHGEKISDERLANERFMADD